MALAIILPSTTEAAMVLIADVTGRKEQTDRLLEKINTNLTTLHKAKAQPVDVAGSRVTSYAIPKDKHHPARTAYFCVKQDRLMAADNLDVLRGVLGGSPAQPTIRSPRCRHSTSVIAALPKAARASRCPTSVGSSSRLAMSKPTRIANPDAPRRRGTDMLKILKNIGFTAIQGRRRLCPPDDRKIRDAASDGRLCSADQRGEDRYELAANMLDFPNGGDFMPQTWVPREVATYASFNLKPKKVFASLPSRWSTRSSATRVFDDVIKSIEEDPNGPQINVRTDLVDVLGGRATVVSDYLLPITPKSERLLMAIQTTDEKKLAATIEK